jgi:hypothetical protein
MLTRTNLIALFTVIVMLSACTPQSGSAPAVSSPGPSTNPSTSSTTAPSAPTSAAVAPATTATAGTDTSGKIVAAANAFLATLSDTQRSQAVFDFSKAGAKAQWSNLPAQLFKWNGVRMGDPNDAQKQAVRDLLTVTLSQQGYQRLMAGVAADEELKNETPGNPQGFGADNYYVAVFGTPSATQPLMFRFGGHHNTVNATIAGANLALTPSFPGCQPCEYTSNGQTVRPDADQFDKGFKLVQALDATQQQQAIRGAQGIDLVLGPNQTMRTVAPEGLKASAMSADQQAMLLDLIGTYVNLANDQSAAAKMTEVKNNLADTYFAWYGPTTNGSASYYRIQGPTLWIEFSPQGGGGTGIGLGGALTANHVHAIYRDPTNEYGAKWAGG